VTTSLKEFQRYCLEHNVTFVSYVMPEGEHPVTLWCTKSEGITFKNIAEIDEQGGFLLSPFQSENSPVIVIPDTKKIEGRLFDIEAFPVPVRPKNSYAGIQDLNVQTYHEYEKQIEAVRQTLTLGKARKVVLSRTKILDDIDTRLLPEVFEELVSCYNHAFVYLLYTPDSGIWLGATPESLIRTDQYRFTTMALAGTKAFAESTETAWAEKELKEQEYVVNHVRQKLIQGGYLFEESDRQTVRAGNVVHLRTMFSGKLANNHNEWKNLVNLLYPTPAICGTDAETTLQVIQQAEKHRREYYTGIIGPFQARGQTNLFINLRCMKVAGHSALLFAGGGILGESSAQKEWEETELKFNTLIQVVSNVMVKADNI
jgi:isochorismate synthase